MVNMTLIEILADYYKLTEDEKCLIIEGSCPFEYIIFKNYAQGQYDWYKGCSSSCYECWNDDPIGL